MKKIVGLILALCLLLCVSAGAFAAGKPQFTQHPQSATTNKQGTVSFSVKVRTNGTKVQYTWYFVNPENGEKISGRKITGVFKGLRVTGPNRASITLKKVPEAMHGWTVYCHIAGNGYKLDSEPAVLSVFGKDVTPEPTAEPTLAPTPEPTSEPTPEPVPEPDPAPTAEPAPEPTAEPAPEPTAEPAPQETAEPEEVTVESAEAVDREITVTASDKVLYLIDSLGNVTGDTAVASLTFTNTGSFAVRSENPIRSWIMNGIRFEPMDPVKGFNILNVSEDVSLNLNLIRQTAASSQVDESVMCKVTCEGCAFTYFPKGLISASEGEVPSGAVITVFAKDTGKAGNGYVINGAAPDYQGKASFSFTVREDTSIILE